MKTKFNFKKNILSNTYKVYEIDKEIGFIKKNYLSHTTIAELKGKKFVFNDKGFFEENTQITDSENRIVGKIKYDSWRKKAYLNLFEYKFSWQYENMWNSKWNFTDNNGKDIEFSTNGNIEVDQISDDELEILSALYVHKHYQKAKFAVMIIILTPIFFKNIIKLIP